MGSFICLLSACLYQQYCSERSACFLALLFVYNHACLLHPRSPQARSLGEMKLFVMHQVSARLDAALTVGLFPS